VSMRHVLLALLAGAVTYPFRALPLLLPGAGRLPEPVAEYLRLVGPAVLAALAATGAAVTLGRAGPELALGVVAVATSLCAAVTRRLNLLVGLVVAVAVVAGWRAL
jgi:branched-subunit amino acid transport protein